MKFAINSLIGSTKSRSRIFKYSRKTNPSLEKKSHLEKLNNFPHKLKIRPLIREYCCLFAQLDPKKLQSCFYIC